MMDNKGFSSSTLDVPPPKGDQLPPPAPPLNKRRKLVLWTLRYALTVVLVGVGLFIPIYTTRMAVDIEEDEPPASKQYNNLIFFLFLWLLITWIGTCFVDIFIMCMPYLFRVLARYINPAHHRYWRVFRQLRKPITLTGGTVICYIAFSVCINSNDDVAVNWTVDPNTWRWDDTINDILEQLTFAVAFYVIEKCLILYISIHYHSRAEQGRNTHSKEIYAALAKLYDTSVYIHPVGSPQFTVEDTLIKHPGSDIAKQMAEGKEAQKFLGRMGYRTAKKGRYFGDDPNKSRWFAYGDSYGVIERALAHEKSAAALATRVWRSLVANGEDSLKASDIEEVLGPYRREEAQSIFKAIDENESKDIKLEEMVLTSIEAGRIRSDIYRGMVTINHCLNTFEWIIIGTIATIMTFFILLLYVNTIKQLQQVASVLVVGLSFAAGRTINKFMVGCIFVFFEHPFDIGDRVQVYNFSANLAVSCIVKQQSLLYTVFQRIDTQQLLQITNERLISKRIENVTRSGANRETRSIFVDVRTTFVDIMQLRTELEAFLKANPRDYMPNLGLNVIDVAELNKIEIRVAWVHKNNWSNEPLRAKRSGRFMCALVAAIRKVPIMRPGGVPLGTEERPYWTAQITNSEGKEILEKKKAASSTPLDEEVRQQRAAAKAREDAARETFTKVPASLTEKKAVTTGVDLEGLVGPGVVGMRNKAGSSNGLYYP